MYKLLAAQARVLAARRAGFRTIAELERVFAALSEGGQILMPLDDYGFSQRFGWVNDRFGAS